MASSFTTAGSLVSHQPRKEPRHDHGRRFDASTQAFSSPAGGERSRAGDDDPAHRNILAACWQDVVPAGRRRDSYRPPASSPGRSSAAASQFSLPDGGRHFADQPYLAPAGTRPVHFHRRCDALHPGGQEDRKHLQYRQSPTTAEERPTIRQAEARPKKLPQLYDGFVDYAVRYPHSVFATALHAGILSEKGAAAPDHGRGGRRSD